MAHTMSLLKVMIMGPIQTFYDKLQLTSIFIKTGRGHIGKSRNNFLALPSHQQCRNPSLKTCLLCATNKRNVHPRTGRTELRRTRPSPLHPRLTSYSYCSIPGVMVVDNLQVSRLVLQRIETLKIITRALLRNLLLN